MSIEILSGGDVYIGSATPSSGGGVPAVIEELDVTPSTSAQTITAPEGVDGYSPVNVSAVTSSIDANIQASNIKSGVSILGVEGSVTELNGETVSITPSTSQQIITPTSPANGITTATVSAVTSSIDANIVAGNIKDGVSILGVTGTLTSGDTITATNTTGSAVSADDKVWVNGEDVYTRDFTTNGNTIVVDDSNRTIEITSFSDAVAYKQLSSNISLGDNISVVIKLKLASNNGNSYIAFIGSNNSTRPFNKYIMMGKISDQVCFQIVPGNNLIYTGLYFSSIVAEQYYWFKLDITNGVATASYSTDGQSWNYGSPVNVNTSTILGNYINFYGQTTNTSGIKTTYDCSWCTISVNNSIVWTPYVKTGTNYSIINDTDITSTSFTGIAQANIANNATGSVKTLLEGNGTYAPTTATKSITTNGTYTASAENAYGLSEVTVDVPTINNTTVNITPTRSLQTFTPESPYTGYNRVRVYGVTKAIDTNIQSNNIKEGVSILSVTGTLTPTPIKEWCNWKTPFSWSSTTKQLSSTQWYSKATAYGDGNFVTVSNGSKAEYSTDGGTTWHETNMPSSADWSCIAYGDGVFVAVASTYSSQTGSNKAAYSTDGGVTWNSTTMPNTRLWSCIAYGDGKFIAIARNVNKCAQSSDGQSWTEIDIPQNNWVSIAYGNGTFVAISHLSYNAAYSTDGGTTWHTSTLTFDADWKCITYGNGVFVAVDNSSGLINYSTDGGATWSKANWKTVKYFYSVVYGDGKFIAISSYESYKYAVALSSTDGNTWTAISNFPNTSKMTSIAYGNGTFVCTGSTNTVEIGSQSSVYTLEAEPTTSSTVYSAPNTTSALTITSVGTGTITLSDSKVYNRNSADDEDYVINITQNGTYDVTEYVSAVVDVPSAPTKKYNLLDRVKDDNNNEIGTVSGFFTDANNVEYAVVCLDAQYRLDCGTWCSNTSTVVTDLPVYDPTTWGPWEAKETATFNTQKILDFCRAQPATSGACVHCRSISFTIDGTTYYGQLPNMIEVNDIVRNHTALNTADPTASSYSSYDFSEGRLAWSSSQYSNTRSWIASMFGAMQNTEKNGPYFVVPVLEIPNT